MVLVIAWVPFVAPIKDAGIKGQFRFLTHAGPWFILLAVFCGNSGIFLLVELRFTVAAEGRWMGFFAGSPVNGACRFSAW